MSVIKPSFYVLLFKIPSCRQIFSVHYVIIFDISFIIEYSRIKWSYYPPDWLQSVGQYKFSGKISLGKWNYWSSNVTPKQPQTASSLAWLELLTCVIRLLHLDSVNLSSASHPMPWSGEFPPGCTTINPIILLGGQLSNPALPNIADCHHRQ